MTIITFPIFKSEKFPPQIQDGFLLFFFFLGEKDGFLNVMRFGQSILIAGDQYKFRGKSFFFYILICVHCLVMLLILPLLLFFIKYISLV